MRALLASAFLIAMLAVPAHASAVTVVSLTFDDGRGSQAAAANALNAHGFDGTFYINSAAIGGGGSLSLTQLNAIADAGHEIGSHGVYHINLPANDADEQRRLLCDDRNWLLQQGFEVTSYAYPYSSYAGTAQQSVAACGFTSGRAGWELNIGGNCGQTCAESIPPRNPWAVRTFKPVDVETSVADLQAQVLNALNHGGGWVPIMFHDICSNCGFYAMSTADLNAFLDWLATQPVEVRTVRDVMDVTTIAPPVQSPAPPPRDPANLLQNPGMETIGAGWVLPFQIPARCWQQDGAWSVEAEWARVSGGAHSGSWSMTIDLPSNDPVGYHELVASPDLGGCAVPAAGGDRFRFTGWYRSEGQVSVVHRVRQGPWSWQSATIDATLPPAAAWTPFSVDLPALPGGATAMVPGIRIRNAGTLFLDDLGLTEIGGGPTTQTLTVAKAGTGAGTVTSSPGGISCGSDCSEAFTQGTSVTLSQSAAGGSTFAGWSGACSGTGGCTVTMDQARSVTATFTAATPTQTLTVTKGGSGTGTVTSSPAGISCGSDCSQAFDQGTSVTLSQSAGADTVFAGWSGACSGTGACTVTMDQARAVTATFNRTAKTLTVSLGGTGTGSVTSSPGGISCGSDCTEAFAHGTSVTLTPSAAAGSAFSGWSGSCTGSGGCTVTMDQARTVTASFAPVPRQLTVTRQTTGGATGTVTSAPVGINCGTTCIASFPHGTDVELSAAAGVDSVFTGWSGVCAGAGTGPCTVDMTQGISVTATFARTDKTLTVTRAGTGSGTVTGTGISCGTDCTHTAAHGTSITLTAAPAAGSTFAGWTGPCSGTGSCTVTLSSDLEVSANFSAMPREISVALIGDGLGTVTSAPAGISCGSDCTQSFAVNQSVTLTAAVGADSSFAGWSGAACQGRGTLPTCTINVAVNASYAVGARFDRLPKALTVTRAGGGTGSVTSSPGPLACGTTCTATFPFGEVVSLAATPGANMVFAGWGGACSGTSACTVTMDAAKAVTATFERTPRALDVAVTGGGGVTSAPAGIGCPAVCAASFGHGTDLVLTASPSPGSSFVAWGGACTAFAATCTVSMTAARSVTAEFTPLKHMLTVTLAGAASGSVTGSAPGLVCPASCTAMVDHGAAVTLAPAPAAGAVFAGWSGACSGTGACTVMVDGDRTATARFEPARQRLSLAFNGSGRVTSKPAGLDCRRDCQRQFANGTSVALTPTSDAGWRFLGWRGACAGAKRVCTVSMTQARSTTVVFVRNGGASLGTAGQHSFVETASAKRTRPRR